MLDWEWKPEASARHRVYADFLAHASGFHSFEMCSSWITVGVWRSAV